jgi:DNA-binding response OmpR family regulator
MILLIAPPSPTRTGLLSFLKHERLHAKVCDTVATGMRAALTPPAHDLVVVDYRLGSAEVREFTAKFARRGQGIPCIVVGVPLRSEADLLRHGALSVFGAGYSPRTVALQCVNIKAFNTRRWGGPRREIGEPAGDYRFGDAIVSPEKRLLKHGAMGKKNAKSVTLSRTQIRLLEAFHASPDKILSYEFVFHSIWNRPYRGRNGMIREAVSSVRDRFNRLGLDFDQWVKTIYGEGYRFGPEKGKPE